jgi:hypothetical protein
VVLKDRGLLAEYRFALAIQFHEIPYRAEQTRQQRQPEDENDPDDHENCHRTPRICRRSTRRILPCSQGFPV